MAGYDHFSEVTAALYLDPGADLSCGDVLPVTDPIIHYPNRLCPQLLSQQHVLIQTQTCTEATHSQPDPSFKTCSFEHHRSIANEAFTTSALPHARVVMHACMQAGMRHAQRQDMHGISNCTNHQLAWYGSLVIMGHQWVVEF